MLTDDERQDLIGKHAPPIHPDFTEDDGFENLVDAIERAVLAKLSAAPEVQPKGDAAKAVDETNAVLASRYFELLKVVEAYEKHGVTCQTFRHFVDIPCAECNSVAHSTVTLRDWFAVHASEEDIKSVTSYIKHEKIARPNPNTGRVYTTLEQPKDARQQARYIHADRMLTARTEVKERL